MPTPLKDNIWARMKIDETSQPLTAGVAYANKYVVLDASKGIATITSATITNLIATALITGTIVSAGTGVWINTFTNTVAGPGTVRAIHGAMVSGISMTSGNLVGSRGSVTITNGTIVSGSSFLYGAQGKVIGGTGTIDVGSGMVYGVMGQIDLTGTTITTGYVAAVGADVFGVGSGLVACDLFYGQHAGGGTINSYFRAYGKATYFFEFDLNGGAQLATTAGGAATKYVTMRIDGTVYKIALLANA
jgi:hypothetical protein